MRASFTIGRIAGVPVGVNWSVLIIFGLIAYGLSANRFPAVAPGQPAWAYAAAGVGSALVFFGGLLAHEVSHAIVARRNGIEVSGITLWLFGGVAQLESEARGPGAELRIAGVGPLVSFILAAIFAGIAAALGLTGQLGLPLRVFSWLALINVALAVFNIIPAAPLDGGRLLRAVLWRIRGDREWAARVSSRIGQGFGLVLVAVGLWLLFRPGFGIGGIWLAVVGWFLFGAASAEHRRAQAPEHAEYGSGLRVGQVMTANPTVAPAELSVAQFIDSYLFTHRFATFPLIDQQGTPAGLVTMNRIKSVPEHQRDATRLVDIACPPAGVPTASPDEPLRALLSRMDGCADGRALVWQSGYLVGVVSPSDVRRAFSGTDT